MRIPRYWAKEKAEGVGPEGKAIGFEGWGWSFESLAGAKERALERARRVVERLSRGEKLGEYEYLDLPLREEIVDAIGAAGQEGAIITRNRYGALVLNTAGVCFVDIDFPRTREKGLWDSLMLLLSARRRQERAREVEAEAVQKVRDWAARNPGRSFRVYRTASGLRLLFTDRLYDPVSDEVRGMLEQLESDELYRRLTLKQECFRARLTPKPWRCGAQRPPSRYPRESEAEQAAFEMWRREYEAKAGACGVCRFIEAVGGGARDEAIAGIVDLHDVYTCRGEGLKLA